MLKRYWFVIYPEDRFGTRNIGVSASSKEEAFNLIIDSFTKYNLIALIINLNSQSEVIEDVDIRMLDQNHVVPNMGAIVFRGVWWPKFKI